MKQQIYWHTTTRMPDGLNTVEIPNQADAAIIGGGFTGLNAALALAKRGVRVVVLEGETIGWGASSRNGGMTLTGLKLPMQTVIRKYGKDLARDLFQYSLDSVTWVEQLVQEEHIDCGFVRSGHLLAANKPKHFAALRDEVDFMAREFNHKVHLIPPADLRSEIGTDIYHGALVDEASAGLNPAQYIAGLASACEAAGVILCSHTRVTQIQRGKDGFTVHSTRGNVSANQVLVATSGYTGGATPTLQRKIIPIGSYIIATERVSDDLAYELSPRNRMIFDYKHYLNYFRLWNNRLIFGGRAAFFPENEHTIAQSGEILRREMIEVYPQLKHVQVEYVWGGTLDFAFDMMTHTGADDGLHFALGYAGHGVAMGSYLGKRIAEAMLQGTVINLPFSKIKFPGAPFGLYNGKPWFLPAAGLWHKILDWIE